MSRIWDSVVCCQARFFFANGPVPKAGSCRWTVFISIGLVVLCSGLGTKYLHTRTELKYFYS